MFFFFFLRFDRRKIENSHTNLNKIGGGGSGESSQQLQQREKKMNAGGLDSKSSASSSSSSTTSNVADEYSSACVYYSSPRALPGAVAATVNALNNLNTTDSSSGGGGASNANITISNILSQADQAESSQDFSTQKFDNDDLVTLNNLNETIVLEELKQRFSKNQIYVRFC